MTGQHSTVRSVCFVCEWTKFVSMFTNETIQYKSRWLIHQSIHPPSLFFSYKTCYNRYNLGCDSLHHHARRGLDRRKLGHRPFHICWMTCSPVKSYTYNLYRPARLRRRDLDSSRPAAATVVATEPHWMESCLWPFGWYCVVIYNSLSAICSQSANVAVPSYSICLDLESDRCNVSVMWWDVMWWDVPLSIASKELVLIFCFLQLTDRTRKYALFDAKEK